MKHADVVEAAELIKARDTLREEMTTIPTVDSRLLAFDNDMFVPKAVLQAMAKAGIAYAERRLAKLGVKVAP